MKLRWRRRERAAPARECCPGSGQSVEESARFRMGRGWSAVWCPVCGEWVPYSSFWGPPIPQHERPVGAQAIPDPEPFNDAFREWSTRTWEERTP